MRLPTQIIVEYPRTINAWMSTKVTECRESPEWPRVKQCLTVAMLLKRPTQGTDQ